MFVSGSSDAGIAAAKALGATAIKYPKPAGEEDPAADQLERPGIRVGIIARDEAAEAWRIARERFPEDRKGQLTRNLAAKVSDSVWHKELSERDDSAENSPYWLVPFENYRTMCPYLVGSYRRVAEELGRYVASGVRTLILDVPPDQDELWHTRRALDACLEEAVS